MIVTKQQSRILKLLPSVQALGFRGAQVPKSRATLPQHVFASKFWQDRGEIICAAPAYRSCRRLHFGTISDLLQSVRNTFVQYWACLRSRRRCAREHSLSDSRKIQERHENETFFFFFLKDTFGNIFPRSCGGDSLIIELIL